MKIYQITVNGRDMPNSIVHAKTRDAAVNKWIVDHYGSVFSSSAPYNVSAASLLRPRRIAHD